jgi:hypothetical protein
MDSKVPEFTDGQSIMSYDISIALLKKVLQKIEQKKKGQYKFATLNPTGWISDCLLKWQKGITFE